MTAFNYFKSLFTIDFGAIKQKLFDMGQLFKGLAMGGVAAAKAVLPGGESPGEAFRRVFDSYTKGNEISTDVESGTEIAKIASEDVSGNTTETVYKTSTINNNAGNGAVTIINNDQSTKQVANSNYAKNETYTGSLNVSIDPYFDRHIYNQTA
jgi:gas vesicle protein